MATVYRPKNKEKLRLLNELAPDRDNNSSILSGCESWQCSFAYDDSLFAWSVGNRIVSIIKIDEYIQENSLKKDINSLFVIDCGDLVRSLILSCIPNLNESTAFWHRSAVRKDLFLITGHVNGIIRIWDVNTGKLLLQLSNHKDAVTDVKIISNDKCLLVSTSFDGTTKIWDLNDDGSLYKTLKTDAKPIYACCISKDAKTLVTAGMSKIVNVWESQEFTIRLKLIGHHHNVVACSFSPDDCLIATASWDTSIIIWNSLDGDKLRQFCQMNPPPRLIFAAGDNGNFIRSLAFSPDGYHIATVADDCYVRIWDLSNDNEPEAYGNISDGLFCSYSNSGKLLTVGTRTGSVSIFQSHSCTKSLLFLSRLAVKKYFPISQFNTSIIPKRLINFLNFKEWN